MRHSGRIDQADAVLVEFIDVALRSGEPRLMAIAGRGGLSASLVKRDAETILWRIAADPGDGPACLLRVFARADGLEQATREAGAMRLAEAFGFPTPSILHTAPANPTFAAPYMLLEWIEGQPLGGLLDAAPDVAVPLCERVGSLLGRLHSFGIRTADIPRELPIHQSAGDAVVELATAIGASGLESPFAASLAWLADAAESPAVQRNGLAFVHGDFHGGNILMRPDGQLVVLDWTVAGWRDPGLDAAWTALHLGPHPDSAARRAFLAAYARASVRPALEHPFYEAFASLRGLANAAGIEQRGPRAVAHRSRPGTVAFFRHLEDRWQELTGVPAPA